MRYKEKLEAEKVKLIGHFEIQEEVNFDFKRLGITHTTHDRFKQIRLVGNTIELPSPVYMPSSISDKQVLAEAEIRQKGRFPTVTYVHNKGANEKKPKGLGCAIFRSAEPKSELSTRPCKEDESYIAAISQTFNQSVEDKGRPSLYIFTARPDNTEKGPGKPGFESTVVYPNIQRHSYNQNYDALKNSYKDL